MDHHVGFGFPVGSRLNRAVFGAKPGDVREDRLEFGDRIFARVIDNVAGVIPDFEVGVADLFDRGDDFRGGAAAAAVGFHDELDAAFLGEGGGVGHDLEIVGVALGFIFAKREGELHAHGVAVGDLRTSVGERLGEGQGGLHAEGGHVYLEAAGRDLGFEGGEVCGRGVGAGEDVVLRRGEESGVRVTGGFDRIEGVVEGPFGPRTVETTDGPARGRRRLGRGDAVAREQTHGEAGGGGGEKLATSERVGDHWKRQRRDRRFHAEEGGRAIPKTTRTVEVRCNGK